MTAFENLSHADQASALHAMADGALTRWDGTWHVDRLMKYRENAVFAVAEADGTRAALRIHRPGYHSDAALRSELLWMDALSRSGMDVPPLVMPSNRQPFVIATSARVPEPRQVDMLGWVEGRCVADIDCTTTLETIYFSAGVLAARLHDHAMEWRRPDGFQRHAWDADGLIGEMPLWGPYAGLAQIRPDERALLDRARTAAWADVPALDNSPQGYGLIHADLVPENLLYAPDGLKLIDFDDSGFGWTMFELATALFFHIDTPAYRGIRAALLAGYRSKRPLSDESWGKLPLFLFMRSLTYLGWVGTRPETETAQELTPMLIDRACMLADAYLKQRA
ncbi:MAG: aminoglycoside phosphotransferase [Sphingobium sp.]|nr:MAG: aminoglycoside phosphotransferase [Sphingobium sp.]